MVFGDIGTSPLYTLRECLHSHGAKVADPVAVLGILSLIFWSLTLVVTVKYLSLIMRADNHGEGGIFALLAILPERLRSAKTSGNISAVALLVVIGGALLYGDGAITPAISVLSAIEGLVVVRPELGTWVVPITCAILVGLFAVQSRGTGAVGALFGPIMLLWFGTIGALGAYHVAQNTSVLAALNPLYAIQYFRVHGIPGFVVLGSVVLAVTGGEALYADMGHFGKGPIRIGWLGIVMPALTLCYFGQGALILRDEAAFENPFFSMVPKGGPLVALVVLSSFATVIASQALISGAFSLTRQAMLLGYFPRVTIRHTARHAEGQIYIPQINWLLAIGCLLLVIGFQKAERLASAYGIAVTGTMMLTSFVFFEVMRKTWKWSLAVALPILVLFLCFDIPFFLANTLKIADGGWVPVLIGIGFIGAMLIWNRGRSLTLAQYAERFGTLESALPKLHALACTRIPGTAVFMSSSTQHIPPVLVHLAKRTHALAEQILIVTVVSETAPMVPEEERVTIEPVADGFYRIVARYGFMERRHIEKVLEVAAKKASLEIDLRDVTYVLGRENVQGLSTGAMGAFAETIFGILQRNAVSADVHFGIPSEQVIEIGIQLDL